MLCRVVELFADHAVAGWACAAFHHALATVALLSFVEDEALYDCRLAVSCCQHLCMGFAGSQGHRIRVVGCEDLQRFAIRVAGAVALIAFCYFALDIDGATKAP